MILPRLFNLIASAAAGFDAATHADVEVLLPEELLEYYSYADWARVPARNLDALEALTGELAPTDLVTREIAAATLCRLMESTHLIWN